MRLMGNRTGGDTEVSLAIGLMGDRPLMAICQSSHRTDGR